MKLSEAIRKGIPMTGGQLAYYYVGKVDGEWVACAVGTAAIGVLGPEAPRDEITSLSARLLCQSPFFPLERFRGRRCYERLKRVQSSDLGLSIVDLNDVAELSREEIAALLEEQGY